MYDTYKINDVHVVYKGVHYKSKLANDNEYCRDCVFQGECTKDKFLMYEVICSNVTKGPRVIWYEDEPQRKKDTRTDEEIGIANLILG